jgi:Fe-S cluster biosynthesis and repair protein YggX
MASVRCSRCESTGDALERTPLPGAPGELVLARTCRACWELWRGEQVKLINEHKLSPANPEHYTFLVDQMKVFLKLS